MDRRFSSERRALFSDRNSYSRMKDRLFLLNFAKPVSNFNESVSNFIELSARQKFVISRKIYSCCSLWLELSMNNIIKRCSRALQLSRKTNSSEFYTYTLLEVYGPAETLRDQEKVWCVELNQCPNEYRAECLV